jgi:hypothetical protein
LKLKNDMYTDLIKNKTFYSLSTPSTIVPSPTEDDYSIGSIDRYFAQKANDVNGFVYEISLNTFQKLNENPNWNVEIVRWRISGPLNTVYNEKGDITDKGIIDSNKASLFIASTTLKNIGLYLPNVTQFYK